MKEIPKYLREMPSGINRYGIDIARKCLEIEAVLYKQAGRVDAARALRAAATALKKVSKGTATPVQAFDWPESSQGK
jgi:hypothetical protein